MKILKDTLTGWKAPKPYARIASPIKSEVPASQHTINTPDKANATFTAGFLFPLRDDDPEYPALAMANYILGAGTLSSRLGVRIRQKEGLSYGVTSSLGVSSQDRRASFTISAIVNPQNLARLRVCAIEELERMLRDGVTADELDKAREGYLQSMKVGRSSDAALAGLALISHSGGQGLLTYALGHLAAAFSSLVIFIEAVAAAQRGTQVAIQGPGKEPLSDDTKLSFDFRADRRGRVARWLWR